MKSLSGKKVVVSGETITGKALTAALRTLISRSFPLLLGQISKLLVKNNYSLFLAVP